jgi:hypothetical protein
MPLVFLPLESFRNIAGDVFEMNRCSRHAAMSAALNVPFRPDSSGIVR